MKTLHFYAVILGLCTASLGASAALATHRLQLENAAPIHNTLVAQASARGEEFIASGTEPFWSVTVSRRGIVYAAPDANNRRYPYTAPMSALGRPSDLVRVYRLNGQPNGLLVIKKVNSCSDGMSDNVYPYDATLILGNRVMEGCARRR